MLRVLNLLLVLGLFGTAFYSYSVAHKARQGERQIRALQAEIAEERESMKLLQAEWSFLTRPQRLEKLAAEHLRLNRVTPPQLVRLERLKARLPARPAAVSDPASQTGSRDPIGDVLKAVE